MCHQIIHHKRFCLNKYLCIENQVQEEKIVMILRVIKTTVKLLNPLLRIENQDFLKSCKMRIKQILFKQNLFLKTEELYLFSRKRIEKP